VSCIVSDLEKILLLFNFLHTLLLTSTLYSSSTLINFSNLEKLYSIILFLCFYFLLLANIFFLLLYQCPSFCLLLLFLAKAYLWICFSHNKASTTITTTTKPYPIKWGRLHGSNDTIVFYHKPYLDPTH